MAFTLVKPKTTPLTRELKQKAQVLAIAGDETRIRILCLLYQHKKLCVSDIAKGTGTSIAAASHHLQMMKEGGLVRTERAGNHICYLLVENEFTKGLKKIICS